MGRAGEDHVLLQLAATLETAEPWFQRRPSL
jgi:Asp-tRNA(Asn)/Glu-tRNA(Gln) amidotransferase A subunit family amidase